MTLTEFITARLDEDEALARASIAVETQERTYFDGRTETLVDRGEWTAGEGAYDECRVEGTFMIIYDEGGHSPEQARHIARHDPARVLADVAAKRAIVEMHRGDHECVDAAVVEGWGPAGWYGEESCPTLRILATIYADHPSHDEGWRP